MAAPKEKNPWAALVPATQAAIRCGEPAFRKFLDVETKEDAANVVRRRCQIESRAELNTDPESAKRWRLLDNEYAAASHLPEQRG